MAKKPMPARKKKNAAVSVAPVIDDEERKRWGLPHAPPTPKALGAIARAQRLIESFQDIIAQLEMGARDSDEASSHDALAESIDRIWKLYMRRNDLEQEAALRFLEAVEYRSQMRPNRSLDEVVELVRGDLGARFPEYLSRVDADVVGLVIRGLSGLEKKAPALFDAINKVIGPNVYKDDESLRVAYGNWLAQSGWKR